MNNLCFILFLALTCYLGGINYTSAQDSVVAKAAFKAHNDVRDSQNHPFAVKTHLTYDTYLQYYASKAVGECSCPGVHAEGPHGRSHAVIGTDHKKYCAGNTGENIIWGPKDHVSSIKGWIDEVNELRGGRCQPDDFQKCGHYQNAFMTGKRVGCWAKECPCANKFGGWQMNCLYCMTQQTVIPTPTKPKPKPTQPPPTTPKPTQPPPTTIPIVFPTGDTTSTTTNEINRKMLAKHNSYRARHGVPLLSTDNELARQAQAWSDGITGSNCGSIGHHDQTNNNGENIYGGQAVPDATVAVEKWYDEIEDYDFGNPGTSHNGRGIGHFTQVVWKSSAKLGCGVSTCDAGRWRYTHVTCRYSPPGNYIGRSNYAANVFAANY